MNAIYEPIRVDESSNMREIGLRPGQQLQLSLKENPTTGFRWELQESGAPTCKLREDRFLAEATGGVGKGGTRRWLFEAGDSGTCHIALGYRRAWESKPPDRTFRLTVRIGS